MTREEFNALGSGMSWAIYENEDLDNTNIDLSVPEGVADGEYVIIYEHIDNIGMSDTLAEVRNGKFDPVTTGQACYEAVCRSYLGTDQEPELGETLTDNYIEEFEIIDTNTLIVACGP